MQHKKIGLASLKDETDNIYGDLKVIKRDESKNTSDNKAYWLCECKCGNIVSIDGGSLRKHTTTSCGCVHSKGEQKISSLLKEHNIKFEKQKTFETCRFKDTNALAYFDFYLSEYNILIEYDGIQHFKYFSSGWNTKEKYLKTVEHDNFKNNWCKENGIKLIRIPYTKLEEITIKDLVP